MPEDQPVFDFDELSWGDSKKVAIVGLAINKATADGNGDAIMTGFAEIEAIAAQVVVKLPRSWLVRRAPAEIDFTQPGAFDWLKSSKFDELTTLIGNRGVKAEEDSENL